MTGSSSAIDVEESFRVARQNGWVKIECSIQTLKVTLSLHRLMIKANRQGGSSDIQVLKVRDSDEARKGSMSAMVGTGAQPLHTDGAHLVTPPRYIALACEKPTSVPTRLLRIGTQLSSDHLSQGRNGVFSVRDGKSSFWSTAHTDLGGWRYDPLCMFPQDLRAKQFATWMREISSSAEEFDWSVGDCLLIDNRAVLHSRADASAEPNREIHRIAIDVIR